MPTTILRPHLLTFRNRIRFRKKYQLGARRELLMVAIIGVIAVSIFFAFRLGFQLMRADPLFRDLAPTKIIELTFHYFFILLIASNTVAATGNIYNADNMNLLFTAPISRLRLYTAKFLETGIETGVMYFLFLTPAALAYYSSLDLPPQFLLNVFALSLLFLPIPVGIGIVLATIAARFIALVWRRGAFFISVALLLICYGFLQMVFAAKTAQLEHRGGAALAQFTNLFENPSPLWTPSRWIADVVCGFLTGSTEHILPRAALLALSAAASFSIGFLVFDIAAMRVRSASTAQHRMHSNAERNKKSRDLVRNLFELLYRWIPYNPHIRAVILKDLSSLVRDRSQSVQLLLYLGISTIYIAVFHLLSGSFQQNQIGMQLWHATLTSMHLLFTGFILTTVTTRLVYPSMSLEGRSIWILQVTPIRIDTLIRAKLLCWLPITTAMTATLLLAGVFAIGLDPSTYFTLLIVAGAIGYGYTGLAIGLGCSFATFDWESPNQITVGTGALTLLLLGVSYIFLLCIPGTVLIFLISVPALANHLGFTLTFFLMSICLALILLANVAISNRSCRLGARALERTRGTIV